MIGGLAELSSLPTAPSETTLRQLIRDNPDFPVIKHGKNGVGYEIDFDLALAWLANRAEEEQAKARQRAADVRQYGMDLGLSAAVDESRIGLSFVEQRQMLEAEVVANKLARERGELVLKSEVDAAIAELLGVIARQLGSFSARLAKKVDLPREVQVAIDRQMETDRAQLARNMEEMGLDGIGEPDSGTPLEDTAV